MKNLLQSIFKKKPVKKKAFSFDMDDNLFYLPTKILYFAKDENAIIKVLAVSTEEFAKTREKVGVVDCLIPVIVDNDKATACEEHDSKITLNLKDYQVVNQNSESFQQFRDVEGKDHFLDDLKKAIAAKAFAPSFNDFVESCACEETAKRVSIVTARGHAPATFVKAFQYLQSIGMIKYVPLLENIYPVSYDKMPDAFRSGVHLPQIAKMNVLTHLLDEMKNLNEQVYFGFSDDDKKTFDTTKNFLEEQVIKGRWPNIKVNIYFTGKKIKERFVLESTEPEVA